jgi:hypothetical protein
MNHHENHPTTINQFHCHLPDDILLLALLRTRKYSMDKVFESAEKFTTTFAQYPDWFDITPERLERCLQIIEAGTGVVFNNRDDHGRRVLLINPEMAGILKSSVPDLIRTMILAMFFLLLEDETQICGINIIVDCSRVTTDNIVPISIRTIVTLLDMVKMVPLRIKEVNLVGLPAFVVAVYEMVKGFMSEKLRSRVKFHKEYEVPKYSKGDVVDAREKVEEMRDIMEKLLKIKVDPGVLEKYGKSVDSVGSFRKLEID